MQRLACNRIANVLRKRPHGDAIRDIDLIDQATKMPVAQAVEQLVVHLIVR